MVYLIVPQADFVLLGGKNCALVISVFSLSFMDVDSKQVLIGQRRMTEAWMRVYIGKKLRMRKS